MVYVTVDVFTGICLPVVGYIAVTVVGPVIYVVTAVDLIATVNLPVVAARLFSRCYGYVAGSSQRFTPRLLRWPIVPLNCGPITLTCPFPGYVPHVAADPVPALFPLLR